MGWFIIDWWLCSVSCFEIQSTRFIPVVNFWPHNHKLACVAQMATDTTPSVADSESCLNFSSLFDNRVYYSIIWRSLCFLFNIWLHFDNHPMSNVPDCLAIRLRTEWCPSPSALAGRFNKAWQRTFNSNDNSEENNYRLMQNEKQSQSVREVLHVPGVSK